MKKIRLRLLCLCLLAGCGGETGQGETTMEPKSYKQISAKEAKNMMDGEEEYTLLDVRSPEEFDTGHIEGAIVIPDTEITHQAEKKLTRKDATILVYCRSGSRSKRAAKALADLDYTNVYEFGGIIDWPYDIVK